MLKILFTLKDPKKTILNLLDGHTVDILSNEESLLPMVEKGNYNLIMLEGGIDLIPSIKAADPRVEVILFGERQDVAIEAIRQGASAYFPFTVEIERVGGGGGD